MTRKRTGRGDEPRPYDDDENPARTVADETTKREFDANPLPLRKEFTS
jgi:hypothetical protein